jgi:hypothetical protein
LTQVAKANESHNAMASPNEPKLADATPAPRPSGMDPNWPPRQPNPNFPIQHPNGWPAPVGPPNPSTPAPATPQGPLSGNWQASTGAMFHIDDNGQDTLTIQLVSSDALRGLAGRLVCSGESLGAKVFTGNLSAIFAANPSLPYTVETTVTASDLNHLQLFFPKWPRWTPYGKFAGKNSFTDVWTRSGPPVESQPNATAPRGSNTPVPDPTPDLPVDSDLPPGLLPDLPPGIIQRNDWRQ